MSTITPTRLDVTVEQIGPNEAAEYLANMAPNRKESPRRVENLARQMRSGDWIFDGSPIRFDVNGRLLDGQNRLTAVIRADVTLPFTVIRGLPPESMKVMDTGKTRTLGDLLQIQHPGLKDPNMVAAITRIRYLWDIGARGGDLTSSNAAKRGAYVTTGPGLLDYFGAHQDEIIEETKIGRAISQKVPGIGGTALGLAWHLFMSIDPTDAEWFFEHLQTGADLPTGHPLLALRRRVADTAGTGSGPRGALRPDEGLALLIKTWNFYRDGASIQMVSFKRGGAKPEKFPEPH